MNKFNKSIDHLQKLYNTAGPFYLSEFYQADGNKKLYNFLTSVYQTEYTTNFRILVVQDCTDVYDYEDLPGKAICTLQQYVSQIDISNFFVVIVTGNKKIDTELMHAQKLYSTDDCKIQSYIVNNVEYTAIDQQQDTFCVLPWMHLYIGPDGNVLPCCVADQKFPMGNINDTSVDDISKSSTFNLLRTNMLAGNRSKECSRCYTQEDAGLRSARQSHNVRWSQKKLNVESNGTLKKFKPVYLDIRLNNICNLKCRMCSGYYSSAIAQEEAMLFGNQQSVDASMQSAQKALALENIIKYLPQAEKIYFAGGEPLLAPEHYKILDALIACGNTNLEITYNTNFTTLTYRGRSVLDLWKQFSNIKIGASLDAEGAVAEYVRHGTKWNTIESNLELVKSQCPHINFIVTSTVGLLNVDNLIRLQQHWHTSGTLDILKFSQTVMIGPKHLTVSALPLEHKQRLEQTINHHVVWCRQNNAKVLATQWVEVLNYMLSKDNSHSLVEFKRLTEIMDQHRDESLEKVIPELKNLL